MTCCNDNTTNTAIEQAVIDALADRTLELEGYKTDASESASDAATSASQAEAAKVETLGYRNQTQTIFNSAQELVPKIGEISATLQSTSDVVNSIAQSVSSYLVKNYYYQVIGGESKITVPASYEAIAVQAIYIEGARQDSGYGFVFDNVSQVITLAEPLPEDSAGTVITIQIGAADSATSESVLSILAGASGAGTVGTASGESVQVVLDKILAKLEQWGLNQ